jgi:hypothetical protein
LKIKHVTLERQNSYFIDDLRCFEVTSYCSDEHAWFMAMADHLIGKTHVIYDGIAGDMLSGASGHLRTGGLLEVFRSKSNTDICKKLFEIWGRPDDYVLRWMLDKNFHGQVRQERAIAHLSKELKKHLSVPSPVRSFYFWNRTLRKLGLSPYALKAGIETAYSPYLDYDLYDFLSSLPEEIIMRGTLHAKAIARAYPKYADIPYEQNDANTISVSNHRIRFSRDLAWDCLKRNIWSSQVVRGGYLATRMLGCLVSKKYSQSVWWLRPPILHYLVQLERLQQGACPGGEKCSPAGQVVLDAPMRTTDFRRVPV